MLFNIVFLAFGVLFSWFTYDIVLRTTDNPFLAVISMIVVLAFWIGALTFAVTVIFKGRLFR
jgi:hypothetical protein